MGELATRRAPLRVTGAVALAVTAFALSCATAQVAAPAQQSRTPHEVVFTRYTPLFSNTEILRRLLSPLAEQTVRDLLLEIDKQYGGLAAPRILQLAAKCACGLT